MPIKSEGKIILKQLKSVLFLYQAESVESKISLLKLMSTSKLEMSYILDYHECLLFLSAYPERPKLLQLAQSELKRMALWINNLPSKKREELNDTGLPYTTMITRFSCDILEEMLHNYQCKIEIDSFEETGESLNTILNITLPTVLKQETTAGLDNLALLEGLGVKSKDRLLFLLNEFKKLENLPLLKDHLWETLKIFLNISANSIHYSRSFNKLKMDKVFFQTEMLKKFDYQAILQKELPPAEKLKPDDLKSVIGVIRKSLLLTMRETDTSTYMEESSLQLYHLERGISIVLYGLKANRQLAYQSYIGYTAFKNGYPAAYGGSWVFGHTAMFGLNILESFRGGESGFMMCQLLRTYIQSFKLSYIEVENYQFGKDNPDGIKSGAFWFYYRYGFRPIDKTLKVLAEKEFDKIKNTKNYRSTEKTLIALSESNIALNLSGKIPLKKEVIFSKVLHMIAKEFSGNNVKATKIAVEEFKQKLAMKTEYAEACVLEEVALWAKAFKINDTEQLELLMKMIKVKNTNALAYNDLIKSYVSILN
jgi:hypothetical protein